MEVGTKFFLKGELAKRKPPENDQASNTNAKIQKEKTILKSQYAKAGPQSTHVKTQKKRED